MAKWGSPHWGIPLWGSGIRGTHHPHSGFGGGDIFPAEIPGLTFTRVKTPEFKNIAQNCTEGYQTRIRETRNPIWHFQLVYEYIYGNWKGPNNQMPFAPYSDIQNFMAFFNGGYGEYASFLWDDPKDRSAAGVLGGPWSGPRPYGLNDVVIDQFGHAQLVTIAGTSGGSMPTWNTSGGTTSDGSVTWTDQGYWPDGFPNAPLAQELWTDGAGHYFTPIQRNYAGRFMEDITDLNGGLAMYANGVVQDPRTYTVQGPGLAVPGFSTMGLYVRWQTQPAIPITSTFNFFFRMRFESDRVDFERFMSELWTIGGGSAKNGSGALKIMSARTPSATVQFASIPTPAPSIVSLSLTTVTAFTTEEVFNTSGSIGTSAGVVPASITQFGDAATLLQYQSNTNWAKRTDVWPPGRTDGIGSYTDIGPLPTTITGIQTFKLSFRTGNPPTLNTAAVGFSVIFRIYAAYFTVNYSDGSNRQFWPTVQSTFNGNGHMNQNGNLTLSPQNAFAVDQDTTTYAELEGTAWGNFGIPFRIELSHFA